MSLPGWQRPHNFTLFHTCTPSLCSFLNWQVEVAAFQDQTAVAVFSFFLSFAVSLKSANFYRISGFISPCLGFHGDSGNRESRPASRDAFRSDAPRGRRYVLSQKSVHSAALKWNEMNKDLKWSFGLKFFCISSFHFCTLAAACLSCSINALILPCSFCDPWHRHMQFLLSLVGKN